MSPFLRNLLGAVIVFVFWGFFLFNGIIMLVAPRAWFGLPEYVALRSPIFRRQISDWELRGLGVIFTTGALWLFQQVVSHSIGGLKRHQILTITVCVAATACGAAIALRPTLVIQKCGLADDLANPVAERELAMSLRVIGVAAVALAIFLVAGILE